MSRLFFSPLKLEHSKLLRVFFIGGPNPHSTLRLDDLYEVDTSAYSERFEFVTPLQTRDERTSR